MLSAGANSVKGARQPRTPSHPYLYGPPPCCTTKPNSGGGLGLEPSRNGKENVLVMTDVFSNYTQAVPDEKHITIKRIVPIKKGKLVYLRDVGVRGRHKIQDVWSPVVYRVMRAPRDGGSLYTIAPVEDPNKARNVHRSLLKDHPGPADAETPVACPPKDMEPPVGEEDSFDDDLCVVSRGV